MTEPVDFQATMRAVALQRQKGDALARSGDPARAAGVYEKGLSVSDALLEPRSPAYDPGDLAELHGVRGGLLRRLGRLPEALESYETGARHERESGASSTYNRINAIRLALLIGERTLAGVADDLGRAEAAMLARLTVDEQAADDGWVWADLGDVRLLRGDDDGAASAYELFTRKAASDAPPKTLSVLEELGEAVHRHHDPDAAAWDRRLERVRPLLAGA